MWLGVAIREFPLEAGHGFADYLLYVDGRAAGVIEAKKQGATLSGVEIQSARYAQGLPRSLPAWRRPLPFLYESTGAETHFTNGLDPEPRARNVFAFHRPERWRMAQGAAANAGLHHRQRPPALPRTPISPAHLPRPRARHARAASPSGATASASSGRRRSPPSATWKRAWPPTSRAR
jgi:hypothetical protein